MNEDTENAGLPDATDVGWRLGLFLLERIEPMPGALVTATELFSTYRGWCRSRGEMELLEGLFLAEVAAIGRECGLAYKMSGANISFVNVSVRAG